MRRFSGICVFVALMAIGYALPAHAWTDAFGVGARATAMGGAFAAVADDYAATYYNPAGLGVKSPSFCKLASPM